MHDADALVVISQVVVWIQRRADVVSLNTVARRPRLFQLNSYGIRDDEIAFAARTADDVVAELKRAMPASPLPRRRRAALSVPIRLPSIVLNRASLLTMTPLAPLPAITFAAPGALPPTVE
jgi:hypothetical protein